MKQLHMRARLFVHDRALWMCVILFWFVIAVVGWFLLLMFVVGITAHLCK